VTTGTTEGARAHARAQGGTVVAEMPTVPARAATPPDGVDAALLTWAETVPGGGYAARTLARGSTLRLTDVAGDACAHVLLFNAQEQFERLNVADTVKVLWQAYVTTGHQLLSDQGRVLATVVADTTGGRADSFCGTSTRGRNERRYGAGAPGSASPAGRELLTLAAAKHGLFRRDLPPSLSFFKEVRVAPDGALLLDIASPAGAYVELRAEMPLTVLIANVPHPLDPRAAYTSTPLEVRAWRGDATAEGDPLWTASPEGRRAYLNTAEYLTARGTA
jgi:urea carboxylase-associated protein 2